MNLAEACQIVQTHARHMRAVQIIAEAVEGKAVLENEIREIVARRDAMRKEADEQVAHIKAQAAEMAAAYKRTDDVVEQRLNESHDRAQAILAKAETQAAALLAKTEDAARKMTADAAAAAARAKEGQTGAEVAAAAAQERIDELNTETEAAQTKLDSIRAAIKAVVEH